MIIEPMANDELEENLNVVGRTFYAASTLVCVPNSLADNGPALGAQAGKKKIINGFLQKPIGLHDLIIEVTSQLDSYELQKKYPS
jgi:hypothetical protein